VEQRVFNLKNVVMEKYTLEEIENHLDKLGYSVIKTEELESLEDSYLNHPG
jgi:hypothetical protein